MAKNNEVIKAVVFLPNDTFVQQILCTFDISHPIPSIKSFNCLDSEILEVLWDQVVTHT